MSNAYVFTHCGIGDHITAIGAVRYLKTIYPKVFVACKEVAKQTVESFYCDDPDIVVMPIVPYHQPFYHQKNYTEFTQGTDIFLAGSNLIDTHLKKVPIPYAFYADMGLKYDVFWNFFKISTPKCSFELREKLKNQKYAFIHNSVSSCTENFSVSKLRQNHIFDTMFQDDIVLINPCTNMYTKDHAYYDLANEFVNRPLVEYMEVIIHADYVILSDSSFFCMSLQLPIKTNHCYCIPRTKGANYDYLYDDTYGFNDTLSKKRFICMSI